MSHTYEGFFVQNSPLDFPVVVENISTVDITTTTAIIEMFLLFVSDQEGLLASTGCRSPRRR
jgi:hypothetical protein